MKKKRDNYANKINRNKKINKFIIVGVVVAIALIVGVAVATIKMPSSANAAIPIDGIQCNNMEQSVFHIHAHLAIFINGQNYTVPAQIGITSTCFYWLHTHDETGIIHIESPIHKNYTLGQFFDIWKKNFSNTQIFNNTVSGANPLNVYVNGIKVPNGTNFKDVVLHAHDVIAIVYGKPPNTIPTKADFSSAEAP
jgi:hypothetical protein